MVGNTKESSDLVRNMVKENSYGLTEVHTLEVFSKIIYMDRVFTLGRILENTSVLGSTIKWMGKVRSRGLTDANTKVTTRMT